MSKRSQRLAGYWKACKKVCQNGFGMIVHGLGRVTAAAFLLLLCLAAAGAVFAASEAVSAETEEEKEERQKVQLEYYQYNVCASCHPEDTFYEIISEELGGMKEEYPYEIFVYNTFHEQDKERLEKKLETLGLQDEEAALPVLMVGDVCLSGSDEIREGIRAALIRASDAVGGGKTQETAVETEEWETDNGSKDKAAAEETEASGWRQRLEEELKQEDHSDCILLYFSTVSCDDCTAVKQFFSGLNGTVTAPDGTVCRLRIHEFNIAEEDYVLLLKELFKGYGVPEAQQQVPAVFWGDGWLSGADRVISGLKERMEDGSLTGLTGFSPDAAGLLPDEKSGEEEKPFASPAAYLSLAAAGFINGVNPCGASMLLMLLAAVAVSGRSVLKTGLAYIGGKFAAYCAMGMGLYRLFLAAGQEVLLGVSRVLTGIFAAFFLVLAVLYLIDFIYVKKQEYGKIRMQLPGWLRKWNHRQIEAVSERKGGVILPAAFILGIIISAGEFFCTGQVYLAAILYLLKVQEEHQVQTLLAFVIYVAAMCVPSLLITAVLEKTGNVIRMSNASVSWLPAVKLATAAVFFFFAVFMLLS